MPPEAEHSLLVLRRFRHVLQVAVVQSPLETQQPEMACRHVPVLALCQQPLEALRC